MCKKYIWSMPLCAVIVIGCVCEFVSVLGLCESEWCSVTLCLMQEYLYMVAQD